MENPLQNAIAESLPAQDVNAESSPASETPQVEALVETPTPKVEQVKEPPFHEHPRWKEIQEEKRALQQQNQQLMDVLQKTQAQPHVRVESQPENLTPEENAFWDKNRKFLMKEAEPLIQELKKEIQETKMTQMALVYRDFQQRHPDVIPGSSEEAKVADYFRKGLDLDTAYEAVFAPIKAQKEIEKYRQQNQVKTQNKIQANVETSSVSQSAIPSAQPKNFREKLKAELSKAGF